jgi:predicted Na+-dependent transporter
VSSEKAEQGSGVVARRRLWANASGSFEQNNTWEDAVLPSQVVEESKVDFLKILKSANTVIPHIVLGSTILALVYPPSFTWFTTRYYAPALGFLMFAVGVNSSVEDFVEAIKRPDAIAAGYIGQFIIKPLFGFFFGTLAATVLNLPTALGAGIMLVSCVSGAQLSNYATFLTDPHMAPLSIVMTSLSTATAVFVTPTLSYFLIGQKLPVDVKGMMSSIVQIVVAPIAAGLLLNRFLPKLCVAIQPFLPPLSVFVTALCVGSPLAINIRAVLSPFGLSIVLLLFAFHTSSFVAGYHLAGTWFHKSDNVKALQRTISFETGMQSSLLALALANRFFPDPLVGVPPAISVVLMSLMGFALVMVWSKKMKM